MLIFSPMSLALLKTIFALTLALSLGSTLTVFSPATNSANGVPRPSHVVIVIEENHSFAEIIGSPAAPYINSLAQQGALFTQSFAIEHPSQPNYLDLFSGSNQGVSDSSCPHSFSTPNMAAELISTGQTFGGFSEDLPAVGSTACSSGSYMRKHNPWVNFDIGPSAVSAAANMPFPQSWPADLNQLPTVSFVVPNQLNDMHDGTIQQGDTWLQNHLDAYVQFARTHNSLLIITFDEDDGSMNNQIATIFIGPMVVPGQYSEQINHFNVLRTIEDMYGLGYAGASGTATPIVSCWSRPTAAPANVSGRIVDPNGTPVGGVKMHLSGAESRSAMTDANGNYHFDGLDTGNFYTVTPMGNYQFAPASRSFSLNGDLTDAGFTAYAGDSKCKNQRRCSW